MTAHLEQEFVSRQPLDGGEQEGGQAQAVALRQPLYCEDGLSELLRVLIAGQRTHGSFELADVGSVCVDEIRLWGEGWGGEEEVMKIDSVCVCVCVCGSN